MAPGWLSGSSRSQNLEQLIAGIGEPALETALGRAPLPGSVQPEWCLLVLTTSWFALVHSKTSTVASILTGQPSGAESVRRIPLESITSVDLPPARTWFGRLVHGPVIAVSIAIRDEKERLVVEVDETARPFFETLNIAKEKSK